MDSALDTFAVRMAQNALEAKDDGGGQDHCCKKHSNDENGVHEKRQQNQWDKGFASHERSAWRRMHGCPQRGSKTAASHPTTAIMKIA